MDNVVFIINLTTQIIMMVVSISYTTNVQLDFNKWIKCIVFIFIPNFIFTYFSFWLGVFVFFISPIIVFYQFSRVKRVIVDVSILLIGFIIISYASTLLADTLFQIESLWNLFIYEISFIIGAYSYTVLYRFLINKWFCRLLVTTPAILSVFMLLILTIVVFYLNYYLTEKYDQITVVHFNLIIQIVYFIITLVVLFFLISSLRKEYQTKQRELALKQFHDYMQALEQVNRDMQQFRHDYRNILMTMNGYIQLEDFEGLKAYFQNHIMKVEQQTIFAHQVLGRLDNLEVVELKGLLATKVVQADELEIEVLLDIPEVIQSIPMDIIDLTRIIGILFDNAIEASLLMERGRIEVAILQVENTGVMMFIVRNYYEGPILNIQQLFNKNYSTKGHGRGMGLAIVRQIIGRYSHVVLNTYVENKWFIQELEIRK